MHGLNEDDYRRRITELLEERDRARQRVTRECSRIRRELLDEIGKIPPGRLAHDPEVVHALLEVRKALDRVCPEEK